MSEEVNCEQVTQCNGLLQQVNYASKPNIHTTKTYVWWLSVTGCKGLDETECIVIKLHCEAALWSAACETADMPRIIDIQQTMFMTAGNVQNMHSLNNMDQL